LLAEGIAALDPDVIGVQEVVHSPGGGQVEELVEGWRERGGPAEIFSAFAGAWSYENGDQFGNAVLSRYPIRDSKAFQLPTRDARALLFTRIETEVGNLPFFVTHLSWKFDEGILREDQVLATARRVLETVEDDDLPAILVGDLNAAPDATEIRFLRGLHSLERTSIHFTDCFERVGKGDGFTFVPADNPGAALTYEAPRRIDYVLVRGPDGRGRGMPLSAKVVLDQVAEIGGARVAPSDHYGVFAEVAM
jgi:endonuclease/exonuclease/phosphatase family metal-dependent hydrolase